MKKFYTLLILSSFLIACQPVDDAAKKTFEKNAKTVQAYIDGFEAESLDYETIYSKHLVVMRGTSFGSNDSTGLPELMMNDRKGWAKFDFELLNKPAVLLPGVDSDTKELDGSVRYYGTWKVSLAATDTTEERHGVIKLYESFDFDADGKIIYQQYYGDGSGLFLYLNNISVSGADPTEDVVSAKPVDEHAGHDHD
jgi:hypothetical protein